MIKPSDIPQRQAPTIDVEALIKEIEQDAINHKLDCDGRFYDLTYDPKGVNEVKEILINNGYDALHTLTGYRNGTPQISLLVSVKRT